MPSREASTVRVVSRRMPRGPGQRIRAGNFRWALGCFRRSTYVTGSDMAHIVMAAPRTGQNLVVLCCVAVTGPSRRGKQAAAGTPSPQLCFGDRAIPENPLRASGSDGSVALSSRTTDGGLMENGVERRAARRFSMMLPLRVRFSAGDGIAEKPGETRDVSFRGLYFVIEANLESGSSIEFVLTLPQQITLAGDVHIRCYARVLRVDSQNGRRGVAAQIERYEFLPALA